MHLCQWNAGSGMLDCVTVQYSTIKFTPCYSTMLYALNFFSLINTRIHTCLVCSPISSQSTFPFFFIVSTISDISVPEERSNWLYLQCLCHMRFANSSLSPRNEGSLHSTKRFKRSNLAHNEVDRGVCLGHTYDIPPTDWVNVRDRNKRLPSALRHPCRLAHLLTLLYCISCFVLNPVLSMSSSHCMSSRDIHPNFDYSSNFDDRYLLYCTVPRYQVTITCPLSPNFPCTDN